MLFEICAGAGSPCPDSNIGLITGTFFNGRISFSAQIVEPDNVTVCVLAPSTVARTVSEGCTIVYELNTACLRSDSANSGPTSPWIVASLTELIGIGL